MNADSRLGYLIVRAGRYAVAEVCFVLGNVVPARLACVFWALARRLNPHHVPAALNRATALAAREIDGAWDAFLEAVEAIENPKGTGASDLALTWVPGRLLRRVVSRFVWGATTDVDVVGDAHDAAMKRALTHLASHHAHWSIRLEQLERARRATDVWESVAGANRDAQWCRVEVEMLAGAVAGAAELADPLIAAGRFCAPLESLEWARRFLEIGDASVATGCVRWAQAWVPEHPDTWRFSARLAEAGGDAGRAREYWERAVSLDPEEVATTLEWLRATRQIPGIPAASPRGSLEVTGVDAIELGDAANVKCELRGVEGEWRLYVLPPAGWGVIAHPRAQSLVAPGAASVELRALRPDRVRGDAWPVTFLAIGPAGYLVQRVHVSVADREPGRVLVAITEDHELHEERGRYDAEMFERLFVDKSRLAASHAAVPWTHMVEVGSTLELVEYAGAGFEHVRSRIEGHLVDELRAGNDLQPHVHAFNSTASTRFPYTARDRTVHASLDFLLTRPESRRDFASACPPPGEGGRDVDRLAMVGRVVARLEEVARRADPDYNAVAWRSGLLEYGKDADDRQWSTVALRRAGLLADSDVAKPRSVWSTARPAFQAGWSDPFRKEQGGVILQMPIAANLEGDYVMGRRLLRRRARRSVAALGRGGSVQPGVHLFTVITHDKFLNARAGRSELDFDTTRGDWALVREHVRAWQGAGAEFVTVRSGVEAAVDDWGWQAQTRLVAETFVTLRGELPAVRFEVKLLSAPPASAEYPQHVLVTLKPSIRAAALRVTARQAEKEVEVDEYLENGYFWMRLVQADEPVFCEIQLTQQENLARGEPVPAEVG